eukprot:13051599-Alexandrium_andersonii.AAC.1
MLLGDVKQLVEQESAVKAEVDSEEDDKSDAGAESLKGKVGAGGSSSSTTASSKVGVSNGGNGPDSGKKRK